MRPHDDYIHRRKRLGSISSVPKNWKVYRDVIYVTREYVLSQLCVSDVE